MIYELLLLIKKHTDTLSEQTKIKPQETLEFKLNTEMESFSFSPPINLAEDGKWMIAVNSFGTTNSVFYKTNRNKSFSITLPGHWNTKSAKKTTTN